MEGPGDYPSSLERPRIITSGGRPSDALSNSGFTSTEVVSTGGNSAAHGCGGGGHINGGGGGNGGGASSSSLAVTELSVPSRESTPSNLTTTLAAQYHSRYLHSGMPGKSIFSINFILCYIISQIVTLK